MRIVILSTETDHHTYFINRIVDAHDVVAVFYETEHARFPFDTAAPFSAEAQIFERGHFFTEVSSSVPAAIPVQRVGTVNVKDFAELVAPYRAELALVFGCGLIRPHVFSLFPKGMINVHRGIATAYRGLDSDLWAIYHNDFDNIGVTLHFVEQALDTGDIAGEQRVALQRQDRIFHLRYKTTAPATDMMLGVLANYAEGRLKARRQTDYGRYYSAMPAVLKPGCVRKFDRFIKQAKS